MVQREVKGVIEHSSFRPAGTPSPIIDGYGGASVPIVHCTQIAHHAMAPSESMHNQAARGTAEIWCVRVFGRGVGRRRDDSGVVKQSAAKAVRRTIADGPAEGAEVEEFVSRVRFSVRIVLSDRRSREQQGGRQRYRTYP